jgi:hypothetical protein
MFVGSSDEDKELIEALGLNLKGKVTVSSWATTAWPLSRSTLDGLEEHLENADFATFILNATDVAIIRKQRQDIPRDNVLFELGMSFGHLGRDRTFILVPDSKEKEIRVLSDLLGIVTVPFERDGDDRQTMANPARELWATIKPTGLRYRPGREDIFERGDAEHLEKIADSALYVLEPRDSVDELKKAVLRGERVPAKFQFAQPDGGRHWLSLCRTDNYKYFEQAKEHLRNNRTLIAELACEAAGTAALDLISLGCGDGSKDETLLRALAPHLGESEHLYYYPIDISDILLVETIRRISKSAMTHDDFRCKAVLGDFTNLQAFATITGYRANPNLFSVLGNTLGSFDESDILNSIAGAMLPGDLVLIEANIGDPQDSLALLEDDDSRQWDLSTLDALGIPRDSCELEYQSKTKVSDVPGTRTLTSFAVPSHEKKAKYMLSGMHHYDFEELKSWIADELNVELIGEPLASDGVGLLLGQRKA